MKKVIIQLCFCLVTTTAMAQSTTIIMPDGTMMVCTTIGTIVVCEKI
jgi:hypothetical protein